MQVTLRILFQSWSVQMFLETKDKVDSRHCVLLVYALLEVLLKLLSDMINKKVNMKFPLPHGTVRGQRSWGAPAAGQLKEVSLTTITTLLLFHTFTSNHSTTHLNVSNQPHLMYLDSLQC